ncbi:conserved hypothetical protein [Gammaproteobacteria bacterium]
MNKLQLVQRLRQEAGISGTGPTTTVGQVGELGRLVAWIEAAYEDIQDKRKNWDFLRLDFTFNTAAGNSTYPQSTVVEAPLANWKADSFRIYLTAAGVNDERWIRPVSWSRFRDSRLRGASRNQLGRPIEFSIDPRKNVVFWPKPNDVYTINGEFFRKAETMDTDIDVPVFDRYPMAIVFNALMRYAAYNSEPALYATAQKEYGRLIGKIETDWTPQIRSGGAMA